MVSVECHAKEGHVTIALHSSKAVLGDQEAEKPVISLEIACRAPSANCQRSLADSDSG
jgi:hypothetical protein